MGEEISEQNRIESWKQNNPQGYDRALEEEKVAYLAVWDFDGDNLSKTPKEREVVGENLPDNPDKIAQMKGELVESLSPESIDRLDAARTIRDNLSLANEIVSNRDVIDSYSDDMAAGLFDDVKRLEGVHDLNAMDLAQRYGLDLAPETVERMGNTPEVNAPEAVALALDSAHNIPVLGGM
ncbi:MAG: hypothetical protein COA45_06375 [Zetaproteobacteria bacterium]|nr:MAG: hypothetical protein COA45_06375 [Zetaproteobacteria bacterium]